MPDADPRPRLLLVGAGHAHLHLVDRAAELAAHYDGEIWIECNGDRVNGKSIMGIITLGAGFRSEFAISANGADEQAAVDALATLVERKFEDG